MSPLRRPLANVPNRLQQRVLIWVLVFVVYAGAHVFDLVDGGLDVYGWAPRPVEYLLLALVLLEIAVILLVVIRQAGIALGVAVALAEVALNGYGAFSGRSPVDFPTVGLPALALLAVFVLVTAPGLWAPQHAPTP